MALEPGRGRTAVPVRTTMFGASLSLLALAAALAFGASLDRLVTTPALSGWNWDVIMGAAPKQQATLDDLLDRSPDVEAYARGAILDVNVGDPSIRRVHVLAVAMQPLKGSVVPALVEGRLPQSADEVALGTETMGKVGARIGGTVPVRGKAGVFQMRVVGRVTVPSFFFSFARPGQGAAVSIDGAEKLSLQSQNEGWAQFVRLAPGANQNAFIKTAKQEVRHLFVLPREVSGEISNLSGIGNVPLFLAGIVALMAAATLAHTLITSIRRRRLDLAILKTLGFVRRQISATVAWQATALASASVLIGLPLGIISGRWGWNVFADRLGVVPQAVVPILSILLAVPVTILVANLLAVIPGRIASRLRPGPVLRSE